MQNNVCQIQGHSQSRINAICLDTKCQKTKVCCQMCQAQYHKEHIDQLVDKDYLLNYINTESLKQVDSSSDVIQTLLSLVQIEQFLEELKQLINKEIERIQSQNLKQVCEDMKNKHNLQEKNQGLENEKWNQLVNDMQKNFQVRESRIGAKESLVDQLGKDFFSCIVKFKEIKIKMENQLTNVDEIIQKRESKKVFEIFTESQVLSNHAALVRGIDICKNKKLLASGSNDKTVKLWNLEDNTLIKTYQHTGQVYEVIFSNQGNLMAFGGTGNNSIQLISDLLNNENSTELRAHKADINTLAFSNDSKYLISGSDDKTIIIWDVESKKIVSKLNSESSIFGIAINGDNSILASNSYDGKIRIWDFINHKLLGTQFAHKHGKTIQFSNDQKMLVSTGNDGMIRLWSILELNRGIIQLLNEFQAANTSIQTALISPCSRFIMSICSSDCRIQIFYAQTGQVVREFKSQSQNKESFYGGAISNDMDIVAYSENNNIVIWRKQ